MTPALLNLQLVAGDGYSLPISCVDSDGDALDQSAYTWRAQIRTRHTSTTATDFTVVNGGATGIVTLSLTAVQTRALGDGSFVWDAERQVTGSDPATVIRGAVRVLPDVTRPVTP